MTPVEALASIVALSTGKKRMLAAFMLGAFGVLSFEPWSIPAAMPVALIGLMWLIDSAPSWKAAMKDGWFFGLGHFGIGLAWIANATLVNPSAYGWVYPLSLLFFGSVLGIYPAAACAVAQITKVGHIRVFTFACAWTLAEWVRSWLFTGLPWNMTGSMWMMSPAIAQTAATVGTLGLTFLTVYLFSLPSILGMRATNIQKADFKPTLPPIDKKQWRKKAVRLMGPAALVFSLIAIGGQARLAKAMRYDAPTDFKIRIVQPAIPQKLKWQPDLMAQNLMEYITMSRTEGFENIDMVLWGETAVTYPVKRNSAVLDEILTAIPAQGHITTGMIRFGQNKTGQTVAYNSLMVFDHSGNALANYNKSHLVPFGEYVPFGKYLPMNKITPGRVDFSPGQGPVTLAPDNVPAFSPLICYEVIFPGAITQKNHRPQWLLNITNDGWYGNSSGPYQHFAATRLRAIEEGLPLVRVANTGISAVVDAYGIVRKYIGLNKKGVIDAKLPQPTAKPTTFALFGHFPVLIFCLFGLIVMLMRSKNDNNVNPA